MTLDELAASLAMWGYGTVGDARKAISDALRSSTGAAAVRVRRGHYRSRGLARSTLRWMRAQVPGEVPIPHWAQRTPGGTSGRVAGVG